MELIEYLELPRYQRWVIDQYPGLADHPMCPSRKEEYEALRVIAERHYDFKLTLEDFDNAIAFRFGFGCEFEWPED